MKSSPKICNCASAQWGFRWKMFILQHIYLYVGYPSLCSTVRYFMILFIIRRILFIFYHFTMYEKNRYWLKWWVQWTLDINLNTHIHTQVFFFFFLAEIHYISSLFWWRKSQMSFGKHTCNSHIDIYCEQRNRNAVNWNWNFTYLFFSNKQFLDPKKVELELKTLPPGALNLHRIYCFHMCANFDLSNLLPWNSHWTFFFSLYYLNFGFGRWNNSCVLCCRSIDYVLQFRGNSTLQLRVNWKWRAKNWIANMQGC